MFSFHKPRVYRSTEGCCICRAKSSSSRFTDSKKYENDSMKCFDLKQPRFGEICNACVLLVKRYKRLPVGSNRHWGHVVDARAGPGTKSLTKYKKNKDETYSTGHQQTQNGKSIFPEKFSKIFKKNKKAKSSSSSGKKDIGTGSSKRKSSTSAHTWDNHQSLPSTPDSLDSDYEDHNTSSPSSTVVQFQTQTRASSYRSRNGGNVASAISVAHKKRLVKLSGSRRRKCLPPRKNRHRAIENVQFFDESEWQERKSCCGMVYECVSLGGALIVDLEHYKPCSEHQRKCNAANVMETEQATSSSGQQAQKTILASMPAVVQLATASTTVATSVAASAATTMSTKPLPVNQKPNPTPVLKKHHLFFKRQSECFPHADLSAINHSNSNSSSNNNSNTSNINQMTSTITSTATKTDLQISTAATTSTTTAISLKTSSDLTASTSNLSVSIAPTSSSTPSPPIMPRNSSAKITTLSPTPTMVTAATPLHSSNYTNSNNKSNSFLHKIKADTGKIVKHSLEKINTAVRIKSTDLNDMRHMIKTVDKSYLLTKPHQPTPVSQTQTQHHANISIVNPSQPLTSATLSSSSSSSSATKFSDNSSDSGFDENLQDRKSASPLQEDTEKKMLTRPGVQTMFLASGVQIQGQQQNLILTGNEVAAKILQNRKQHTAASAHQHNNNRPSSTATTAVKIAQIVGGTSHKMRAIYNNNAIQHENGVTTIVPASSLAASSQTAAMAALAPSTVTITPSPPIATTISNLNGKKLSSAGHCVIGVNASGNGAPATGVANGALSHQSHVVGGTVSGAHLNTIGNNVSSLNQKIILVKTAKYNNNNNSNVLATTSSSSTSSAAAAITGFHNNNNHNTTTTTSVCKN